MIRRSCFIEVTNMTHKLWDSDCPCPCDRNYWRPLGSGWLPLRPKLLRAEERDTSWSYFMKQSIYAVCCIITACCISQTFLRPAISP